jgi:hypothetical protein
MESGTYKRDVFKANLRVSGSVSKAEADPALGSVTSAQAGERLLESYLDAARACGQDVKGLTAKKLQAVVDKQTAALRKQLGCKDVSFRVTVQDGKVKLKASPVRA